MIVWNRTGPTKVYGIHTTKALKKELKTSETANHSTITGRKKLQNGATAMCFCAGTYI